MRLIIGSTVSAKKAPGGGGGGVNRRNTISVKEPLVVLKEKKTEMAERVCYM